ncbi:biotin transport system substrate-specific component [Mesorhizobium sp. J18]|uniref:biotin transporter BioY n=1 Tax=Mesorhizobium sp. J18 TaxID=935263 RepID=UPI00119A73B4|nr:biotin transporter BioY [Mesorhizobium sp. J18]TWG89938.1 biotin transport system substrate-specific component [Mesorhizobium sp. J18]
MTFYESVAKQRRWNSFAGQMTTVVACSLLLAVSAKISVPFYPVPLTMQTFVVIGLGLALGPARGGAAVLLYLAEGVAGLPVLAGTPEKGVGLAYMMGPTGGYLLGYLPAVLLAGMLAVRGWDRHPVTAMTAALLAGAVIYVPGLVWLGLVIGFDKPVLEFGLYPFILGDIVKAMLAALLFPMAWKALKGKAGH